jgi:hypothetical protein
MQASTCKMHIQMQQSCSWACSPYLCAQIFIDPFPMLIMFPFYLSPELLSLWLISPPLSTISNKGAMGRDSQNFVQRGFMWDQLHFWFNLAHLHSMNYTVWSKGKLFHTSYNGYLALCWSIILWSCARSNTRIASSQTSHMLPLDQINNGSNSGTIQHEIIWFSMNDPRHHLNMTICTNMSLASMYAMPNNCTLHCWRRGMSYSELGASTHVGEV